MAIKRKLDKDSDSKVYELWEVMDKFGKYQILQYSYICFGIIFVTIVNINYIFLAGDLDYRCRIPECEDWNSTLKNLAWWHDLAIDKCSKPILNQTYSENHTCTPESFSSIVEPCTEWIYESNDTIVGDLNLACQPLKVNLVGTVHSFGMLISMLVAGGMSDRFGRKPAIIFCVVATCIGHAKTFSTSYYMYIAIEWIEATLTAGAYPAAMVLMIEISGKKNRLLSSVLFSYAIYVGESLYAVLAMLVPYWKTLARIIYTPGIICISLIFLIRESPQWQLLTDKTDKATETIKKAAEANNVKIKGVITDADKEILKDKLNVGKTESKEGYRKLFTSKHILIRLFVAAVVRFTASFVYYGLMINSVWLPGNKYTNFLMSTVMSFPGELISLYLMNKIGRKLPLLVEFALSGILCVASGYVSAKLLWLKITLFLLGKMVIASCFTGAVTYSMELFPTNSRGTLLGVCAFASRIGSMLAPLTPMLYEISESLPAILFGVSSAITAALVTLTPETRDLPLFDTIEQVEASMKKPHKITISTIS